MDRLYHHAVLIAPFLVVGGSIWSWEMALSILIGEGLAWINLRWLIAGVNRVIPVDKGVLPTDSTHVPMAKYLIRLVLILLVLFAMIQFSFLSPIGTLLGLSIFVLSGMLEAILLLIQKKA